MKSLYYSIFYQLAWCKDKRGYYVHKRWWVWLLFFPLLLPFLLIIGFGKELGVYIEGLSQYKAFYIQSDTKPNKWKLTRKQRISYKKRLLN